MRARWRECRPRAADRFLYRPGCPADSQGIPRVAALLPPIQSSNDQQVIVMLNISADTVCFLIARARAFHSKEDVVLPDNVDNPAEDWALQMLADHEGDLTFQEFKAGVEDLEPDQRAELVALLWLGRGDFSLDEWREAVEEARRNATPYTAEYLIAHPLLADYLLEGLALHGHSCEE